MEKHDKTAVVKVSGGDEKSPCSHSTNRDLERRKEILQRARPSS